MMVYTPQTTYTHRAHTVADVSGDPPTDTAAQHAQHEDEELAAAQVALFEAWVVSEKHRLEEEARYGDLDCTEAVCACAMLLYIHGFYGIHGHYNTPHHHRSHSIIIVPSPPQG